MVAVDRSRTPTATLASALHGIPAELEDSHRALDGTYGSITNESHGTEVEKSAC